MSENIIVRVEDLTMAYHDKPVLWDNDVSIIENSRTAIIGPNGAGKSTLLKGILGLQKLCPARLKLWAKTLNKSTRKLPIFPNQTA